MSRVIKPGPDYLVDLGVSDVDRTITSSLSLSLSLSLSPLSLISSLSLSLSKTKAILTEEIACRVVEHCWALVKIGCDVTVVFDGDTNSDAKSVW